MLCCSQGHVVFLDHISSKFVFSAYSAVADLDLRISNIACLLVFFLKQICVGKIPKVQNKGAVGQ